MLMGRIVMLITSSLLALSCQGCVGTVMSGEYAASPVSTRNHDVVVSEGIRLATEGVFDTSLNLNGMPQADATRSNLMLGSSMDLVGPVIATSVSVGSTETPLVPWRQVYSLGGAKDVFLDNDWSGSEALSTIQGSRGAARLVQPVVGKKDFSAAFAFGATNEQTGFGFDLNLVPSVSYREEGEFETRRVGAGTTDMMALVAGCQFRGEHVYGERIENQRTPPASTRRLSTPRRSPRFAGSASCWQACCWARWAVLRRTPLPRPWRE